MDFEIRIKVLIRISEDDEREFFTTWENGSFSDLLGLIGTDNGYIPMLINGSSYLLETLSAVDVENDDLSIRIVVKTELDCPDDEDQAFKDTALANLLSDNAWQDVKTEPIPDAKVVFEFVPGKLLRGSNN